MARPLRTTPLPCRVRQRPGHGIFTESPKRRALRPG